MVKTRDRDESIDKLLRRASAARTLRSDTSGACLDPEVLAAWVDGNLSRSEVAEAEAHASECARCQQLLANLVRLGPTPLRPHSWWRRWWIVPGLVPLTAGAVALALWIAVPNDKPSSDVAVAPTQQTAPSRDVASQPPVSLDKTPAAPSTGSPALLERADGSARRESSASDQQEAKTQSEETRSQLSGNQTKADAVPPPSAATAGGVVGGIAAPLSETVASERARQASPPADVVSPDPSIRWRIGPAGLLQHTSNGGSTWEPVASGTTEDLTAGAAPTPRVCWVVGRAGTVLLTMDSSQWVRVPFPEAVDLTAVQATDARSARVTTVDGRAFRTADAGQNWTRLQEF